MGPNCLVFGWAAGVDGYKAADLWNKLMKLKRNKI
jgi:hypothetical protein